ncbi:MAG: hypothetical protein AAF252_07720 [Pseudomonadota bacterium]
MAQNQPPKAQKTQSELRQDRLKAALKANMGRRKAQTRARQAKDNDPEGANEESS